MEVQFLVDGALREQTLYGKVLTLLESLPHCPERLDLVHRLPPISFLLDRRRGLFDEVGTVRMGRLSVAERRATTDHRCRTGSLDLLTKLGRHRSETSLLSVRGDAGEGSSARTPCPRFDIELLLLVEVLAGELTWRGRVVDRLSDGELGDDVGADEVGGTTKLVERARDGRLLNLLLEERECFWLVSLGEEGKSVRVKRRRGERTRRTSMAVKLEYAVINPR